MAKSIPDGFTAITPYLVLESPEAEIAFLNAALDAKVITTILGPGGSVMHAQLSVDGACIMMGKAAGPYKPLPALIYVYVPNVDATFARAAAQPGVTVEHPPADQFYGDRMGTVKTANGITWSIATRTEEVSPEQIADRMSKGPKKG